MTTKTVKATKTGHTATTPATSNPSKTLAILYGGFGVVSYLAFLFTALYAMCFIGNLIIPKTVDAGLTVSVVSAVVIDLALLGLFAVQHSVMARPAFKRWWTRVVPQPIERSVYVLFASVLLALLFWLWQPVQGDIWNIENPVACWLVLGLYGFGWLVVVGSTFLINHFDLFGLRQVYAYWQAKQATEPGFQTPLLYKLVRHPMMVGFLITFWATPRLTIGHAIFSLAMTVYTLVGIHLEERDLLARYGDIYRRYQRHVRMLAPLPRKR